MLFGLITNFKNGSSPSTGRDDLPQDGIDREFSTIKYIAEKNNWSFELTVQRVSKWRQAGIDLLSPEFKADNAAEFLSEMEISIKNTNNPEREL